MINAITEQERLLGVEKQGYRPSVNNFSQSAFPRARGPGQGHFGADAAW